MKIRNLSRENINLPLVAMSEWGCNDMIRWLIDEEVCLISLMRWLAQESDNASDPVGLYVRINNQFGSWLAL